MGTDETQIGEQTPRRPRRSAALPPATPVRDGRYTWEQFLMGCRNTGGSGELEMKEELMVTRGGIGRFPPRLQPHYARFYWLINYNRLDPPIPFLTPLVSVLVSTIPHRANNKVRKSNF